MQTTFPVYQADSEGRPDAIGSTVLLDLAGARFMLTATHVAEKARQRNLAVPTDTGLLPVLGEPTHVYREGISSPENNDIDVTMIRFTHPEWGAVDKASFLTWEDLDIVPNRSGRDAFALHGYPETKQRGGLRGHQLTAFAYQAIAKESPEEWYAAMQRDPTVSLMVGFHRRHVWGPDGKLTAPRMHGMSGSGLWRYGADLWSATRGPRLSAIVIEYHSKGRYPYFLGTRVRLMLGALANQYSDVSEFVERCGIDDLS